MIYSSPPLVLLLEPFTFYWKCSSFIDLRSHISTWVLCCCCCCCLAPLVTFCAQCVSGCDDTQLHHFMAPFVVCLFSFLCFSLNSLTWLPVANFLGKTLQRAFCVFCTMVENVSHTCVHTDGDNSTLSFRQQKIYKERTENVRFFK